MDRQAEIHTGYQQRRSAFHQDVLQWQARSAQITLLRLAIFVVVLGGLGLILFVEGMFWLGVLVTTVSSVGFVGVVMVHEWVDHQRRRAQHLEWLQACGLARIERDWHHLAHCPDHLQVDDELQPLDTDLDVTGKVSLFRLCSSTNTKLGQQTLLDWLMRPATEEEVARRQDAVRELAAKRELCEEIHVRSALLGVGTTDPEAFFTWAEGPRWLHDRPWLIWLSRLVPLGLLAVVIAIGNGLLPDAVAALLLLLLVLSNGAISVMFTGQAHDIFGAISSKEGEVQQYGELFELLRTSELEAGRLRALQTRIADDVTQRLSRLNRIMFAANLRHSVLGVFYFILQMIMLWDFHALWFLERWQKRNGDSVRRWFVALAEWEALASFATLAHDHPHWVFPQVDSSIKRLEAANLGHPHLSSSECVSNDVEVGPVGQLLLVTGSNMSGKSTLLRALGCNILLAQAGAPVCANELRLPLLRVHTSMRISDSLADGTSFYMAELKRLKEIVDLTAAEQECRPFFLLDEILQGTNSGERHIAVSRVVAQLLLSGAMGAISTHDLELAQSPEIKSHCQTIHFREHFAEVAGERTMTFDYQLRKGVAPTTNALELLKIVGIE